MVLSAGTRLGPYEIIDPLGVGGMGEVYRARDVRLGREVAVKVLTAAFAADGERRSRFEQEARAASALNHPNIVTIHDVGSADSTLYVAMELVDGRTLRELVASGALPTRKLLDVAVQVAEGLAKAHGAGIVHRDLKPENLIVSKDGFVKILDFGLAKLTRPEGGDPASPSEVSDAETATSPGTILGTEGYMSPEQASGRTVDFRSDQFSLGSILYEMATGTRPFQRTTSAETLAAIIRDDPPPVAQRNPAVPAPLRWIMERCLAKDPDERYASTRDLARDLRSLRDHLSDPFVSGSGVPVVDTRRARRWAIGALLVALALAGGMWAGRRMVSATHPTFQLLTFRRGIIEEARFAPDGHTIVYGAAWDGEPMRLFAARAETPESSRLPLPDAEILSISRGGELAVSLGRRFLPGFRSTGTLARAPLSGGAPRELVEAVQWADWAPDGQDVAIVRVFEGRTRLELPVGSVLYETTAWIGHPRISPRGDLVAFIDHPTLVDDGGSVEVVDLQKRRRTLSAGWTTIQGLAWSPRGDEVWFTASKGGSRNELHSVSLAGRERLLLTLPGTMSTLHDASRDGRVLLSQNLTRIVLMGRAPGETHERDLSWLDWPNLAGFSEDGRSVLFTEAGTGGGPGYGVYLRRTDGSAAVRLAEGAAAALSSDGRRTLVFTREPPRQLVLVPTGVGAPRQVTHDQIHRLWARFLPDDEMVVFVGNAPGQRARLFVQDLAGGEARPITDEGAVKAGEAPSPDGQWVCVRGLDDALYLYPVAGGKPRQVPGSSAVDRVAGWSQDGRSLLVFRSSLERLDLATGRRTFLRDLTPPDRAGLYFISSVRFTPDLSAYVYTYKRSLSELYLVDGLR